MKHINRPRYRLWQKHQSILVAIHPRDIPAASMRFGYTLGLGGITLLTLAHHPEIYPPS